MLRSRNFFLTVLLGLLALLPSPAAAQITVSFYSHELGSSFPHAFIVLSGKPVRGGELAATNYGFTAKSVSPSILMGSVTGIVESVDSKYIASSDRQFTVKVSDAQYDALLALVDRWRQLPGKSYNLNRKNCIHFVAEVAQTLGLKVFVDPKLIKRPRSFLLSLISLNPWVKGKS
jgi:hypothetical protein